MDAQLVSALYRTHKYLPASNKISSLYVFDALARAAKHQAVKHGMPVNVNKGNSATFMLKLEGILEDLFVDLCGATTEVPELKARTPFSWLINASTYLYLVSIGSHGGALLRMCSV